METTTMTSLEPISTSSIKDVGHHVYWPIGAWSKSKSFYVNFEGLVALGLEGL